MTDNVFVVKYHKKFVKWWGKLKDRMAKARIAKRVKQIKKNGRFGDQEFFGDDLWEIRVNCGPGYRLYYTKHGSRIIVLLCGGTKSTQNADIKLAGKLAKEAQNERTE